MKHGLAILLTICLSLLLFISGTGSYTAPIKVTDSRPQTLRTQIPQLGDINLFAGIYYYFLPLIIGNPPEPEPTATPTDPPPPPPPPVIVEITYIFYDGVVPRVESDEYAEITNLGDGEVNMHGWRLNAGDPGQDFIFPDFDIQPGQACRIYTNEYHPDYCGFSFGSSTAIWNNSGDCGYLYNESNELVSTYCY